MEILNIVGSISSIVALVISIFVYNKVISIENTITSMESNDSHTTQSGIVAETVAGRDVRKE